MALDAAAFVPTNRLDLSKIKPDFVTLSFYKMFGFPTGIGALLIRNNVLSVLEKVYWGGGTVSVASDNRRFNVFQVYNRKALLCRIVLVVVLKMERLTFMLLDALE